MRYVVEVSLKPGFIDTDAAGAKNAINALMPASVLEAKSARLFEIEGNITKAAAIRIAEEILYDRVIECFTLKPITHKGFKRFEVWLKKSVTDVVGETVEEIIEDITGKHCKVRCAVAYFLKGKADKTALLKTLVNPVVNILK